jgi:alkylhydroperoxidase/carboxymuconolactone decarboxylase family protein YurZ
MRKGCLDQGATEENILEVISVAAAFGGGAALSQGVPLNPFECAGIRRSLYLKNGIHTIALSNASYVRIYHTKGCLDQGATEENILEVISVAAAFGGGAALSQRECAPESFRMCRNPALALSEKRYSHDCSF